MLIVGLSGGIDPERLPDGPTDFRIGSLLGSGAFHDSAAVLLHDGKVVRAIELERINRIKHSNHSATQAVMACLEDFGAKIDDVDCFAYYGDEEFINNILKAFAPMIPHFPSTLTALVQYVFKRDLGYLISEDRLAFVPHHRAHAVSAYAQSDFNESLVITIDGQGDGLSGTVSVGNEGQLTEIKTFTEPHSIGNFYTHCIGALGYTLHDEYKVMGLAPYGEPQRYAGAFKAAYRFRDDGSVAFDPAAMAQLHKLFPIRAKGEAFNKDHQDYAAALQAVIEEMIFNIMFHYQAQTGQRNLCYAGGVALNSTANGKLLRSGRFDNIFIQPAPHDAGCAVGAAIEAYSRRRQGVITSTQLTDVFLGRHIGQPEAVGDLLEGWKGLVDYEPVPNAAKAAAKLIAEGKVIGWAQGRSEFGPRALGARCILADPRPAENKERVNKMIKKREGYRPFAPSAKAERARDFFSIRNNDAHAFMSYVVEVKPEWRSTLGAVTHVDGTARLQTVSAQHAPQYWALIDHFEALTTVPVVLNTSFNNHAEPIVDDVADAVTCFLTTGLDALVVSDYIVRKRAAPHYEGMTLRLPTHVNLDPSGQAGGQVVDRAGARTRTVSPALAALLGEGATDLRSPGTPEQAVLLEEILDLWGERLLIVEPARRPAMASTH